MAAVITARLTGALDRLLDGAISASLSAELPKAVRDPQALLDPTFESQLPEGISMILRQGLAEGLQGAYLGSFLIALVVFGLAFGMPNRRPADAAPRGRPELAGRLGKSDRPETVIAPD